MVQGRLQHGRVTLACCILGKFTPTFQEYLWLCHVADVQKGTPPKRGSAPHKQMGALAALMDMKGATEIFALPLYGHHGGMLAPTETRNKIAEKTNEGEVALLRHLGKSVNANLAAAVPDMNDLASMPYASDPLRMEMFLRLLFSCLTDADCLNTEAHTNPDDAARREDTSPPNLVTLRDQLRTRQETDFSKATDTEINRVRREVYDDCQRSAVAFAPGVFDLTVPTGGGKTRSSLAFALEHAARHNLRRVIYAIPYTSIVDQTARFSDRCSATIPALTWNTIPQLSRNGAGQKERQQRVAMRPSCGGGLPPKIGTLHWLSLPPCNCLKACFPIDPLHAANCTDWPGQ